MDSQQQIYSITNLENDEVGVTVSDAEGEFVDVNEKAAELYRYDRDELIEMDAFDLLHDPDLDCLKDYACLFNGEVQTWESEMVLGDGTIANVEFEGQADENDIGNVIVSEIQDVTVIEDTEEPETKAITAEAFEDIPAERLYEITANTRIEEPNGPITLNAVMVDMMESHNKLEQTKVGAFYLYEAIDERLAEEKEKNPNSDVVDILEEFKQSAYGLYLRVKRGDEELHGERDGEYSNYWN